jgi:hypothetical protein
MNELKIKGAYLASPPVPTPKQVLQTQLDELEALKKTVGWALFLTLENDVIGVRVHVE